VSVIERSVPDLLAELRARRLEDVGNVLAIARALPPGSRDRELRWILSTGDPPQKQEALAIVDIPETVRLRGLVRAAARSSDAGARGAALVALARAGEIDILPILARALRAEVDEASLVDLANAARLLSPLKPDEALKRALARARGTDAVVALVSAIGHDVDAETLRILAEKGRCATQALEYALASVRLTPRRISFESLGIDRARCRAILDAASDPASAEVLARFAEQGITRFTLEQLLGDEPVFVMPALEDRSSIWTDRRPILGKVPSAVDRASLAHRGAEIIRGHLDRRLAACHDLGERLRRGGLDAPEAAAALGSLGTRQAVLSLAGALAEARQPLGESVSGALAHALGIAPEKSPEDVDELRRLWFPILDTLLPAFRSVEEMAQEPGAALQPAPGS
jgi:hypothetical protein